MSDLPIRVVVGANGAYWRDFGDLYSMCPVSEDNEPVVIAAIYVRDYLDPILDAGPLAAIGEPAEARYPMTEDLDKFTDEQFEAYTEAIGFGGRIRASLAELKAARGEPSEAVTGLDPAWTAVEAMLPEGSLTISPRRAFRDGSYSPVRVETRTRRPTAGRRGPQYVHWYGEGPDLATALQALAARLRETPRTEP